jgi:cysteine-rich repeat protein
MRFATPIRRTLSLATALSAAVSGAPAIAAVDQQQTASNVGSPLGTETVHWQTFTAGLSGRLDGVELTMVAFCDAACTLADVTVEVVEAPGGVPDDTVLASAIVSPAVLTESYAVVPVDLRAANALVTAGASYAIRFSGGGAGNGLDEIAVAYQHDGSSYGAGAFYIDINPCDGLDDPSETNYLPAGADMTFTTYVSDRACGDDVRDPGEACDDGNVAAGDGCSATCFLEKPALACQDAVAKAGLGYATARLKAIQKCRSLVNAGKLTNALEACPAETKTAAAIAKAGMKARTAVAGGRKPKCTDALLGVLGTCADGVDALVAPNGTSGCLLTSHDADDLLDAEYGY